MKGYSLGRRVEISLNSVAPSTAPQSFFSIRPATSAEAVRKSVMRKSKLPRALIRFKFERSLTFSKPELPV